MDLKLVVNGNASVTQIKNEPQPDRTVKTTKENITRISARDETGNILQFSADYETGKKFELGRELTVTIS